MENINETLQRGLRCVHGSLKNPIETNVPSALLKINDNLDRIVNALIVSSNKFEKKMDELMYSLSGDLNYPTDDIIKAIKEIGI